MFKKRNIIIIGVICIIIGLATSYYAIFPDMRFLFSEGTEFHSIKEMRDTFWSDNKVRKVKIRGTIDFDHSTYTEKEIFLGGPTHIKYKERTYRYPFRDETATIRLASTLTPDKFRMKYKNGVIVGLLINMATVEVREPYQIVFEILLCSVIPVIFFFFGAVCSYVGITGKPFSGTVEQVEAQVRKEELNVASMLLTKDKLEPSDIENWRKNKTAYIKYFFCLLLPLSFVFFFTLGGGGVILAIIISWFLSRLFVKARHR